jgi:predicted O-methyltransferase YrrM
MKNPFKQFIKSIAKSGNAGVVDFFTSKRQLALRNELLKRATVEAADLVTSEMLTAQFCNDKLMHLEFLSGQFEAGLMLEFGVYKGTTINHLARLCPDRTVYGFDSFEGLPEDWVGNRYSRRNFNRKGVAPKVLSNVSLVKGLFHETLPGFLEEHSDPIAFVHIDCDIYSSTDCALQAVEGKLVDGAIIAFDEFFNYHGWRLHEYKAFNEFIERTGYGFEYLGFSGTEVSVRIKRS